MKSKLLKTVAAAALLSMSTLAVQAQELKIGFVSSERILRESNQAKAAGAKLEAEFSKREKDLKDLENKLRSAAEKLEKDAAMLSEAERNRRQRDVAETDRELQRKRREWQEDLNQRRQEELQAVVERANLVIKKIFETEKYDLILQDAVHVSKKVDITQKVIDALNGGK